MARDRALKKQEILEYNLAYETEKSRLASMTPEEHRVENKAWLKGVVQSELNSLKEEFNEALTPKIVKKLS